MPGEEFGEPRGRMISDAGEDVGKPGLRVDIVELSGGDQGVHGGCPFAAAVGAGNQPGPAPQGNAAQGAFGGVVGKADAAVVEEAGKGWSARQHIIDRSGGLGVARQPGAFGAHPFFEVGDNGLAVPLAHR